MRPIIAAAMMVKKNRRIRWRWWIEAGSIEMGLMGGVAGFGFWLRFGIGKVMTRPSSTAIWIDPMQEWVVCLSEEDRRC